MIFIAGPFYHIKEHLKDYNFTEISENSQNKVERAIVALSSFSLFSNDYVLLSNIDKWTKKEREQLIPHLNENTIVTATNIDAREKFFKKMLKSEKTFLFEYIKPWETNKWLNFIKKTGKKFKLSIDNGIAFEVLKIVGEDYDRIYSELDKLSHIKTGSIVIDDLEYISNSVIDFTKSIVEDIMLKKKPFDKIDAFFKYKMQPLNLIYSLMKNFQMLLIIKSKIKKQRLAWADITSWSKQLKISSGLLAKFTGFSFTKGIKTTDYRGIYSTNDIYAILHKLLQLEVDMKLFENKSHLINLIEYINYEL